MTELLFRPESIAFGLLAIVYVIGKRFIESKERQQQPLSDEARLTIMADKKQCSEYELFFEAARHWHIANVQTQEDFKRYLTHGPLPHYVRDYIRKHRISGEMDPTPLNPGGTIPGAWSA
jgi:hypothetical protein